MGARFESMSEASPGTSLSAPSCPVVAVKRRPCPSTQSRDTMLSQVRPHAVACGPHALLATMPAIVARFWEEGSGPKRSPCVPAAACRVVPTHPGSTVAVRASGSIEMTRFMWREKSRTRPGPIALDAHEVPPPRAVREVEGRDRLLGRAGERDGQGWDARETGVGGITRSRASRGVDVDQCAQVRQEALAHEASVSRWRRSGPGYPVCGWLIGTVAWADAERVGA